MENTNNTYKALSDQQKLFCEEYIIDLKGTEAAIRAGYEEDLAKSTAGHLMVLPAVRHYIRQLLDQHGRKFEITAKAVLMELASIAFAGVEDFNYDLADGPEVTRTVTQSNCKISTEDKANGRRIVYQFNLRDKIWALVALGKHLGVFEKESMEDIIRNTKFIFPPVALK